MPPYILKPIKLEDCRDHGAKSGAELFVVEGDSAAGAVTVLRNAIFQAVLPMQGKPLNALKATANKVNTNELYGKLATALGVPLVDGHRAKAMQSQLTLGLEAPTLGPTSAPSELQDLRYERVLLLFDPDADGIHIGALMLMFFARWMRPLLEAGRIEMVRPPLFEITWQQNNQACAAPLLAYSISHRDAIHRQLTQQGATGINFRHFRGLGSIDQTLLLKTCIDPKNRLAQVMSIQDAQAAIEVFGNPSPR